MVIVRNAEVTYRYLNGLVCVYKPACVSVRQVKHAFITNLCKDLNALPDRPQEKRVEILGATNSSMTVNVVPNYADDPLVTGPRYQHQDFRCSYSSHLGLFSSGVLLLGLNDGTKLTYKVHAARPTKAYKVQGQLGKATDTYFWNGRTMERATYAHITRSKIDGVVAHMQNAHQKTMYQLSGVDMESQTMYELASEGVIRPANDKLPVLYGIKCVHFEPPNFTLEIQAVNEYEKYLWNIIHELGMQLKTVAHCTAVQCIREGKFDTHMALLRKHWRLNHVVDNIKQCDKLLDENERLLYPKSARLS